MQLNSWVRYGNLEAVSHRLAHSPLDKAEKGAELLGIAAESRFAGVDMLKLLIERGANPTKVVNEFQNTPLCVAAKSGNIDKVNFLLQAGADPNFRNAHGYTPLIHAVYGQRQTRQEIVSVLLNVGANPNIITKYGESPLRTALYFSDFDTLRIILDAGADIGILDWNPLMRAIAFGTLDEVQAELQRGAYPNGKYQRDMTPWRLGLLVGDVEKAEKLVAFGADFNPTDLLVAVHKDNPEIVRWLLDNGTDVNVRDEHGRSALSEAAGWGATACVKLLIEAGADAHAADHTSTQPISEASTPEIVRMLVEAGADINFISGEGYTLLKSAAEALNVEMVRALLDMGAATDGETQRYTTTPLYVAVQQDDLEIAKLLLDAGANPNAQNVDLWFPLSNAQSIEMVQLLLDHGADIHLRDEIGSDALCGQDDPDVAVYLIQAGAEVNPQQVHFGQPLREAANKNNLEIMRVLLQHGANVDQATSWGETPLMTAAEHSFVEGVRLLLDHQASVYLENTEHGRTAVFYAAAPEGFTAYKLMKEYDVSDLLNDLGEEHDLLAEDITPAPDAVTYGYIASDSVEVLEMLLAAGADINARDKQEMTPIILTASCGRPSRVAALLRAGADIHLHDAEGKTALDYARLHPESEHRASIVKLLEDADKC